jgi:hypothetical protein
MIKTIIYGGMPTKIIVRDAKCQKGTAKKKGRPRKVTKVTKEDGQAPA